MVGLEAGNVGGKRWRPVHPVYSYKLQHNYAIEGEIEGAETKRQKPG
jgi:hypothetical protein